MKIGFIGTGIMGTGMISNLLQAGYEVVVFNRTKAHADKVLAAGATWADSPQQVATEADAVLSIVGFPQDVEAVYFGEHGVLAGAKTGQILVDMTTSAPALAQRIAQAAVKQAAVALDAPVSGGDIGAKNGTLTIMVGGDQTAYEQMKQVFAAMGSTINYFGPAGSGQHTKMANQIMIAGTMTGLSEMLVYAQAAGLDLDKVLTTVGGGSAANWSLTNYGPRILAGDYTPGFFVKHFVKDLRIALEAADQMHLDLPATKQAKALYQAMVDAGEGDLGTQGLITQYASWQSSAPRKD